MKLSTTKSSATFETIEVNEIGRKCWLISFTGLSFGSGTISAFFQDCGKQTSLNEEFRISFTGSANSSAFSFNSQLGIPSGPLALVGLSFVNFIKTSCLVTEKTVTLLSKLLLKKSHSVMEKSQTWTRGRLH